MIDISKGLESEKKLFRIKYLAEGPAGPIRIPRIGHYQIVENLVRNAVEALPEEGGEIAVRTFEKNGRPTLLVQDNGPGIQSEIQDRIFDFDFTTRPGHGMGLGLGIVKRTCKEIGAQITLKSAPGAGTEFMISFEPAGVSDSAIRPSVRGASTL